MSNVTCQRTVSKGTISKLPLDSMPSKDVPFKRVAVDIVGPLHPPIDKSNRFNLTLVDKDTIFSQAKALPRIDTKRVAEIFLYRHLSGNIVRHGKSVYVRSYEGGK